MAKKKVVVKKKAAPKQFSWCHHADEVDDVLNNPTVRDVKMNIVSYFRDIYSELEPLCEEDRREVLAWIDKYFCVKIESFDRRPEPVSASTPYCDPMRCIPL